MWGDVGTLGHSSAAHTTRKPLWSLPNLASGCHSPGSPAWVSVENQRTCLLVPEQGLSVAQRDSDNHTLRPSDKARYS